ncbi:dUTPase [Glaciecola sp. XM2]|uniref:dUTP diphosphatase n=1 Tax=Glaciecola sp. XM2 TaxID=1914931 RepID=UPI001BDF42D2|nr:dUTP diphosphatase [Glaciecola sp. XM2]MBT1451164.1 dUTPase [Glaciecola sp. XM2]
MLNKTQIAIMLDLQNKMNTKVNPDWLNAGYAYLRAAMIESVEAIEHHGWKWWKAQQLDLAQVQMELVDIWHFALSHILIEHNGNIPNASSQIEHALTLTNTDVTFDGQSFDLTTQTLVENLELMAGLCVVKRFDVKLFTTIVEQAHMTSTSLFEQYVGKNVLNFFRQDHGYKEGTYIKMWGGREDNEHLVDIMQTLDSSNQDYANSLYQALEERYKRA